MLFTSRSFHAVRYTVVPDTMPSVTMFICSLSVRRAPFPVFPRESRRQAILVSSRLCNVFGCCEIDFKEDGPVVAGHDSVIRDDLTRPVAPRRPGSCVPVIDQLQFLHRHGSHSPTTVVPSQDVVNPSKVPTAKRIVEAGERPEVAGYIEARGSAEKIGHDEVWIVIGGDGVLLLEHRGDGYGLLGTSEDAICTRVGAGLLAVVSKGRRGVDQGQHGPKRKSVGRIRSISIQPIEVADDEHRTGITLEPHSFVSGSMEDERGSQFSLGLGPFVQVRVDQRECVVQRIDFGLIVNQDRQFCDRCKSIRTCSWIPRWNRRGVAKVPVSTGEVLASWSRLLNVRKPESIVV